VNSGIHPNVFADGTAYPFVLNYDETTGLASLEVAGLPLFYTIPLSPGKRLAGVRFLVKSLTDGSATTVSDFTAAVDGGLGSSIPAITTAGDVDGLVTGPTAWLDATGSTISLTGKITFDWLADSSRQGERYKLSVYFLEGTVQVGACCFPTGECRALPRTDCDGSNGFYQGDAVPCDPIVCNPVPRSVDTWGRVKSVYKSAR
jgi:hypothetical protein